VSPLKYELGFYIPEYDILHSHRRENLKSYFSDILVPIVVFISINPWCKQNFRVQTSKLFATSAATAQEILLCALQSCSSKAPVEWETPTGAYPTLSYEKFISNLLQYQFRSGIYCFKLIMAFDTNSIQGCLKGYIS
jgi:hypothetical protein